MAKRCVYKGSLNGTSQIFKEVPVNASQTIKTGDIVIKSSGKASICADAPAAGTVWGVAAEPITTGTTVTTEKIKIDVNPASIYEVGKTGTATPAVGVLYDMGAAAYEIDADDTTGGFLEVVRACANGRYDVHIHNRVQNG